MVGVKNTVSFVQQFLYFFPVFCFSGPQIRLITKGEKKVGLVEREPLKPFLLQHGTKESTKGMARPLQKRKEKNHLMRMSR